MVLPVCCQFASIFLSLMVSATDCSQGECCRAASHADCPQCEARQADIPNAVTPPAPQARLPLVPENAASDRCRLVGSDAFAQGNAAGAAESPASQGSSRGADHVYRLQIHSVRPRGLTLSPAPVPQFLSLPHPMPPQFLAFPHPMELPHPPLPQFLSPPYPLPHAANPLVAYQREQAPTASGGNGAARSAIEHLRKAAEHLQAVGENGRFQHLAVELRQAADHMEHEAAARLNELRQQQVQIQREIEALEASLESREPVGVRVSVVEVNPAKLQDLEAELVELDRVTGRASVRGVKVVRSARIDRTLTALRESGDARILAQPMLSFSGRPASLSCEINCCARQEQGTGESAVAPQQQIIRLEALPEVLGDGRIRLQFTHVIDDGASAAAAARTRAAAPAVTTRRTHAELELSSGQTVVLHGPTSLRTSPVRQQAQLLGSARFRLAGDEVREQESKTTLLILVTAEPLTSSPPLPPGCTP